jgi:hypothetical protein
METFLGHTHRGKKLDAHLAHGRQGARLLPMPQAAHRTATLVTQLYSNRGSFGVCVSGRLCIDWTARALGSA